MNQNNPYDANDDDGPFWYKRQKPTRQVPKTQMVTKLGKNQR